jgi:histidyl-tRNA synthetase
LYIAQLGDQPRQKALAMFEELRKAGFRVSQGFLHNALKHQLEEAQKMNVRYTLILGQKELMDGTIIIRDMESGAQEVVDAKKIIHEIEKRLGTK